MNCKNTITLFIQKRPDEPFYYERQAEFDEFWQQAPPGRYVVQIKRKRPPRSQKQLGNIFGNMIKDAVRQADEKAISVEGLMRYLLARNIPMGVAIDRNYLHALMYVIAPTFDDKGNKITLRDMDTKQAGELFERVRNILGPLGIVIKDPDPNWRNKKLRK